jgi:beta-lactamase regulating signal transducer with metallopeptidase domain
MLTFAYYLLKVSICSGLLFSYYLFMLRNKRFHQYNRFYLLLSVILSWVIPLAKIKFWNETAEEQPAFRLLKVVATGDHFVETSLKFSFLALNFNSIALILFTLISAALLAWLVISIVRVHLLIHSNPAESRNKIKFIFTEVKGTPFSFFKYIFWNRNIDLQTIEGKHILKHELTHVHEKHSADKLFLQIVLIIGWLNPLFWLIRKELNMIHEFIADENAISDGDTDSFSVMLLKTAYPQHSFTLTNSFFHSPIKRRLIMFTTSKRPRYSYLCRLMILPLLILVVVFFSFKLKGQNSDKLHSNTDKAPAAAFEKVVTTNEIKKRNITGDEGGDKTINPLGFSISAGKIIADTVANLESNDTTLTNKLIALAEAQMSWKNLYEKESTSEEIRRMTFLLNTLAMKKLAVKQTRKDTEIIKDLEVLIEERIKEDSKATLPKGIKDRQGNKEEPQQKYNSGSAIASDTIKAKFPGGDMAWKKYLERHLDANVTAKDRAPAGVYTVQLQFIVLENGDIKNVAAIKSPEGCPSCANEAVKLIEKGPKWEPMSIDGKNVSSEQVQFISFVVAEK